MNKPLTETQRSDEMLKLFGWCTRSGFSAYVGSSNWNWEDADQVPDADVMEICQQALSEGDYPTTAALLAILTYRKDRRNKISIGSTWHPFGNRFEASVKSVVRDPANECEAEVEMAAVVNNPGFYLIVEAEQGPDLVMTPDQLISRYEWIEPFEVTF
ncbi:hypothetical protein ACQU0X_28935 [Pseudovibrio ascidiaceicola]|uniref:hypothetical protein n=1 Tax=Pseudovibrio ascidiaceicola TaxID=285279 RepID=UPI003D369CF2